MVFAIAKTMNTGSTPLFGTYRTLSAGKSALKPLFTPRVATTATVTATKTLKSALPFIRVGGKFVRKIPYVGLAIGACIDGYELYKAKTEGGSEEFKKEIKGVAIEWGCTAVGAAIGAAIGAVCSEGLATGLGAEIGATAGAVVGMILRGKTFTERQEEKEELAQQKASDKSKIKHDDKVKDKETPHKVEKPKEEKSSITPVKTALPVDSKNLRATYIPGIYCQIVDDNGKYTKQKHYYYDKQAKNFVEIPNLYYIENLEELSQNVRNEFLAKAYIPQNCKVRSRVA